ncbi:hypothetical protein DID88_004161 [Monilinia fructigena]|uniref:YTH domain-containing protein n=1 Tax=Monilinia fructigena TaxID=38457 RepID=A0A395ISM9_9HELO|nr:hypothetical protein DID88_004161 [Monilinia fructigena]
MDMATQTHNEEALNKAYQHAELSSGKLSGEDAEEAEEDEESQSAKSDADGEVPSKAWGKPFKLEWASTTRLPFYRTRGLKKPMEFESRSEDCEGMERSWKLVLGRD